MVPHTNFAIGGNGACSRGQPHQCSKKDCEGEDALHAGLVSNAPSPQREDLWLNKAWAEICAGVRLENVTWSEEKVLMIDAEKGQRHRIETNRDNRIPPRRGRIWCATRGGTHLGPEVRGSLRKHSVFETARGHRCYAMRFPSSDAPHRKRS